MAGEIPGQLNIPVPNRIGRQLEPDRLFEETFGADRAAAERAAYIAARRCTCGSAYPERWGVRNGHKPGCPRAGARF